MPATWGPFVPNIAPDERKARLRSLRALVRIVTGPRGQEAVYRLLLAEVTPGNDEVLAAAEHEFDRLPTLDRRRVLSSFAASLPPACIPPVLSGRAGRG